MSARRWRRAAVAAILLAATSMSADFATSSAAAVADAAPAALLTTAPDSTSIIIGAGAQYKGYQTPQVTMAKGGSLSVVNLDKIQHTVTSQDIGGDGKPLFSVFVNPGATTSIPAASKLAAGTYDFHCIFHQQHMQGTLTIEGGDGGGVTPSAPKFEQPLFVPDVLTGSHIRIPVKQADVQVLPHGPATRMWTYGGTYPGPTIVRPAGHDTKVTYVDKLPASAGALTVHFHGDHHTSADDGRPTTQLLRPGRSRTYDYPLTDGGKPERAAFEYYHDHRMGLTSRNNWMGLQGMFLVTDGKSDQLRLPSGKYDVPLLVSDRTFTSDNQLADPFPAHPMEAMTGPQAPPGDGTVGEQILANGRFAPYLNVSTHRYRLRLLNGSNFTSYNFRLSDGRPFVQVGTGNGLLPHSVVRQDIMLGPAQRADVIVDFHGELNDNVVLQSVPRTDNPDSGIGTPTASIMQFRVTHEAASDPTRSPDALQPAPPIDAPKRVSATWTFDIGGDADTGTYWTVNGKPFDPARVTVKVPLGATRTWRLHNASDTTHFIHLHEEQWHTISRDGKKPPPWERGLEDTWRLDPGETVTVAGHFTDYTGVFMVHCHMLDHEDHGLMAQFKVVRPRKHRVAVADPVSELLPRAARSTPLQKLPTANPLLAALSTPTTERRTALSAMSHAKLAKLMCGLRET